MKYEKIKIFEGILSKNLGEMGRKFGGGSFQDLGKVKESIVEVL